MEVKIESTKEEGLVCDDCKLKLSVLKIVGSYKCYDCGNEICLCIECAKN